MAIFNSFLYVYQRVFGMNEHDGFTSSFRASTLIFRDHQMVFFFLWVHLTHKRLEFQQMNMVNQ